MAIELTKVVRAAAVSSLYKYCQRNLEEPLGNLATEALLDFFIEEIGPAIYNQAVADAQARMLVRVQELDMEVNEEAFLYWRNDKGAKSRR
ncbi:DUF2164 domain-containing protein [Paludibacterium purpuratum]|uniref:Uncharacterized protein (DUF2164 family) n=1 Tax=Paludibacterium purpuratum TaxID=1144873 RepID=A0A4R7BAF2_9NEIS|nr:DUF2164 domain-containing protein [Paludibacterium purpuratum]TDR80636.1 uncharacterized protein (DUF2164 family) [Paludibacterium purpuratum]